MPLLMNRPLLQQLQDDKRFSCYLELLLKWNKIYNLTAITDSKEIEVKHFEDSLRLVEYLPAAGTMLDVGTGAGFPGIPIAMALPNLKVTLLDSRRKKVAFCQEVVRALQLSNVDVECGRLEETNLQKFDIIVSRATFKAKGFFEVVLPRMKRGAKAILMKGPEWEKELKNFDKKVEVIPYALSDGSKRVLFICPIFGDFVQSNNRQDPMLVKNI